MLSLLQAVSFHIIDTGYEIGLNWLGKIVRAIIEGIGIVGVGIIVFTLVLKAITLPFDIYQRVKMRKQTLIMRNMQPELEKLQKQYANDKNMYNQKMMELYKKNGYSMLGACLPMIISLVVLIVAFGAFRTYSQYANLNMYVNMAEQYRAAILLNAPDGVDYTLAKNENGEYITEGENVYKLVWKDEAGDHERPLTWVAGEAIPEIEGKITYTMTEIGDEKEKYIVVSEEGKYLSYQYSVKQTTISRGYLLDTALLTADSEVMAAVEKIKADSEAIPEDADEDFKPENLSFEDACKRYVVMIGANAAADYYHEHDAHFLWIKNVWLPDVSYSHPIPAKYDGRSGFITQFNKKVVFPDGTKKNLSEVFVEDDYINLTRGLEKEQGQANGYFVLIILSIGLMVLSQFVSMRSNKESNKYQTVDGSGQRTQKIMMVMMPLIYAVFAFMYSAAFSIYMTMSSLLAVIVTLISNLIIGKLFKNKEEAEIKDRYTRGTPWKEVGVKSDKKNKKNKK